MKGLTRYINESERIDEAEVSPKFKVKFGKTPVEFELSFNKVSSYWSIYDEEDTVVMSGMFYTEGKKVTDFYSQRSVDRILYAKDEIEEKAQKLIKKLIK